MAPEFPMTQQLRAQALEEDSRGSESQTGYLLAV